MAIYSLFCGSKINRSAALAVQLAASDAAFVAAIEAFSIHDNPTSPIRRRRVTFLMRFQRCTLTPGDEWVGYNIRHSGRSSITQDFRDYISANWSKHFHE